jgi:hypothetical protein
MTNALLWTTAIANHTEAQGPKTFDILSFSKATFFKGGDLLTDKRIDK